MIISPDISHRFETQFLAAFSVDPDHFRPPDLSAFCQGISHILQRRRYGFRKPVLNGDHIRLPLMVELGFIDGILDGQTKIQDVYNGMVVPPGVPITR
jgi:hypothetical protein